MGPTILCTHSTDCTPVVLTKYQREGLSVSGAVT